MTKQKPSGTSNPTNPCVELLTAYGFGPSPLIGTPIELALQSVGCTLDRQDSDMLYVLMIVFDKSLTHVVGIIKQKGPAGLIGKITFPGGKLEPREHLKVAASRELLEEANLHVDPRQWRFVARNAVVATFVATVDNFDSLRTMEGEPVFSMQVEAQLQVAEAHPHIYGHDVIELLKAGRALLLAEKVAA